MGILKDIETFLIPADRLADDGVSSVSIAMLDESGKISNHVITNGQEDTDTLYQAASISKAIAALCVAKLVDDGVITYDTKVAPHIPADVVASLVDAKTEHLLQYVTIGMLLSHRAGISQSSIPGHCPPTSSSSSSSADAGAADAAAPLPSYAETFAGAATTNHPRIRFDHMPGAHMSYSGGGLTLLQLALEQVTGEAFPALMQRVVFAPLGMRRSRYGDVLGGGEANFARAHLSARSRSWRGARGYWMFSEHAAAGLWSTPTDLLRAAAAVQQSLHPGSSSGGGGGAGESPAAGDNAPPPKRAEFLSPETARRMLTTVDPAGGSGWDGMALGWFADAHSFAHAGENWPGYTCYLWGTHGGAVNQGQGGDGSGAAASAAATPSSSSSASPSPGANLVPRHGGGGPAGDGCVGVAIMTDSMLGDKVYRRIMAAIFVFKDWLRYPSLPGHFGSFDEIVPFAAPEGVLVPRGHWKDWIGRWEGGWEITDDSDGGDGGGGGGGGSRSSEGGIGPEVTFGDVLESMRLRPGATPGRMLNGTREDTLVVDGLHTSLRLTKRPDTGERVILLMQRRLEELRRV